MLRGHLGRPSGIFCLILLIIFLLMRLIMFQASFQIVHSQPDFTVSRTSKQSFVCSKKGCSPNFETRVTNSLCWPGLAFGTNQFGQFQFHSICAHHRTIARPLTKGAFQDHSVDISDAVVRHSSTRRLRKWAVGSEAGIFLTRSTLRLEKSNALHQLCLERPNAFFGTIRCRIRRFVARCLFRTKIEETNCERIVYPHGAILLIVRECSGFKPRRWRHWRWCAGQLTGRLCERGR